MNTTRVPERPATTEVENLILDARLKLVAALGHIDRGGVMGVRLHVDGAVAAIDDGLTALGAGTVERERDAMLKLATELEREGRTDAAEFLRQASELVFDRDTEARR